MELNRRTLLIGAAGLAVAPRVSRRQGDPFNLGVASGDPTPDGVVLWTRLAPNPLADDGHGGMPSRDVDVELVTTSITSDGDGYDDAAGRAVELAENPHIKYVDQRRGYVVCRLTTSELTAVFHTMPYVSRQNAPSTVAASFTVADGTHRLTGSKTPA